MAARIVPHLHSVLVPDAAIPPPPRPWWWRLFRLARRVACRRRPDEEHLVLAGVRAGWTLLPEVSRLRSLSLVELQLVNVPADRSWSLYLVDLLHGVEAGFCRYTGAPFCPTRLVSGMPVEDQVRCDVEGSLRVLVELRRVMDGNGIPSAVPLDALPPSFTVHAVVRATDLVLGRTRERLVQLAPGWIPATAQTAQAPMRTPMKLRGC